MSVTKESLIVNLLELKEKLGRIPKKRDVQLIRGSQYSANLYISVFGRFSAALVEAGLRPSPTGARRISNGELIQNLLELKEKLGRTPVESDITKSRHSKYSMSPYVRAFGAFQSALKEAKLEPHDPLPSKEELIDNLLMLQKNLGRKIESRDIRMFKGSKYSVVPYRKIFGSVKNALMEINVSYEDPPNKKATNEELIQNFLELKEKLGRNPRRKDLKLYNGSKYGACAYRRAFGNISNVLSVAGLKKKSLKRHIKEASKEEIIEDIQSVYHKLSKTMSRKDYADNSTFDFSSYVIRDRFGSWDNLLELAGLPPRYVKTSQEEIKAELQKWYNQNNNDITCLTYWSIRNAKQRREFPFSPSKIQEHFPNLLWEQIIKECGFKDYHSTNQFIQRASHEGKDGQKYLSLIELEVANYLFELKQRGKIQNYEYERPICRERQWTCDFYIIKSDKNELWLEVDGMRRNRDLPYNSGENEKINYYNENDMEFCILSYNNPNIKQFLDCLL